MGRGETEVDRTTLVFPLHRKKGSKVLRFEVGVRWSLPLVRWFSIFWPAFIPDVGLLFCFQLRCPDLNY